MNDFRQRKEKALRPGMGLRKGKFGRGMKRLEKPPGREAGSRKTRKQDESSTPNLQSAPDDPKDNLPSHFRTGVAKPCSWPVSDREVAGVLGDEETRGPSSSAGVDLGAEKQDLNPGDEMRLAFPLSSPVLTISIRQRASNRSKQREQGGTATS